MKVSPFLFLFLTFFSALPLVGQPASSDKMIDGLIGKMTLEEKIDFIGGDQDFHIRRLVFFYSLQHISGIVQMLNNIRYKQYFGVFQLLNITLKCFHTSQTYSP